MGRFRRHPTPQQLGAFFDGEDAPGVFPHVAGCGRCRDALAGLQRIRSAARGEPLAAPVRAVPRHRRRVAVLAPVAAATALILGLSALSSPEPSMTRVAGGGTAPAMPAPSPGGAPAVPAAPDAGPDDTTAEASPAPSGSRDRVSVSAGDPAASPPKPAAPAGAPPAPAAGAAESTPEPLAPAPAEPRAPLPAPAPAPAPAAEPIRLGVPVPTRGPLVREGQEALRAVQAVAEAANRDGGVQGRTVEVVSVPAEQADRRTPTGVDVLVGGFGLRTSRASGVDWILPADGRAGGPGVAAAEITPAQAGAVLGTQLGQQGVEGAVGVVVGPGSDAALADGLAETAGTIERVDARRSGGCESEITELRRKQVAALAIAGPPDLARRCAAAAARVGWRPPGGLLLAPSVAYAGLERELSAHESRTVLGFPSPFGSEPGAKRFHRSVRGAGSYRALISFAAAELALGAVRETGGVSAAAVTGGVWRSDLYQLEAGRNTAPRLVMARWGRWLPA